MVSVRSNVGIPTLHGLHYLPTWSSGEVRYCTSTGSHANTVPKDVMQALGVHDGKMIASLPLNKVAPYVNGNDATKARRNVCMAIAVFLKDRFEKC